VRPGAEKPFAPRWREQRLWVIRLIRVRRVIRLIKIIIIGLLGIL
jgi:hypothetical protein